jgi:hypothetical protein
LRVDHVGQEFEYILLGVLAFLAWLASYRIADIDLAISDLTEEAE